jgi:hypothetical protein
MNGLLVGVLAAGVALHAASAQPPARPDVCELLAPDEIRAVQDATLKERKPTDQRGKELHYAQCFFATTDFARSVSLTVITGNDGRAATVSYWKSTFHAAQEAAGKKEPPRPIPETGDQAFWTGDARAGALYVLSDQVVLRISVGGVNDEQERIRRSKALAHAALQRLRKH